MTAIVMVDGIAYTRKEGVPCYDSGLGWRECQSDESHLAGALVDAQDELATLRAQLAGVRAVKRWSDSEGVWMNANDVLAALGGDA